MTDLDKDKKYLEGRPKKKKAWIQFLKLEATDV